MIRTDGIVSCILVLLLIEWVWIFHRQITFVVAGIVIH